MANHKTQRVKILQVDPSLIVDLLNGIRQHEFLCLPVTNNIPEGTEVLAIHENWSTRRMEFLITHDSFPEVPDGDVPPHLPAVEYHEMRRVPTPFINAEEYREFVKGNVWERVLTAIYGEAKKMVESMVRPLDGDERPEFIELRQKLLCGLAEQQRKHSKIDLTV